MVLSSEDLIKTQGIMMQSYQDRWETLYDYLRDLVFTSSSPLDPISLLTKMHKLEKEFPLAKRKFK